MGRRTRATAVTLTSRRLMIAVVAIFAVASWNCGSDIIQSICSNHVVVESFALTPPTMNTRRKRNIFHHIIITRQCPSTSTQLYLTDIDSDGSGGNDNNVKKDNGQNEQRQQLQYHPPPPSLQPPIHHTAIKTRNITTAIQFYSLLGYTDVTKFRAGPARAAWLRQGLSHDEQRQHTNGSSTDTDTADSSGCAVIELIEVPSWVLNEPPNQRSRAVNLLDRQDLLGLNHIALDVTHSAQQLALSRRIRSDDDEDGGGSNGDTDTRQQSDQSRITLKEWMDELNDRSVQQFGKTLRVGLEPFQQIIGSTVYELAFVYDPDGTLIEFVLQGKALNQQVSSGWDPIILDENNKDINNDGQQFWKM